MKSKFIRRAFGGFVFVAAAFSGWFVWVGDHDWRNREVLKYERSIRFLSGEFETLGASVVSWGGESLFGIHFAAFSGENKLRWSGTFRTSFSTGPVDENGVPETKSTWNRISGSLFYDIGKKEPKSFEVTIAPPRSDKALRLKPELDAAIRSHSHDGFASFRWRDLDVQSFVSSEGQQVVTLAGSWPPNYVNLPKPAIRWDRITHLRDAVIPFAGRVSKLGRETDRIVWPCIRPWPSNSDQELIIHSRDQTTFMSVIVRYENYRGYGPKVITAQEMSENYDFRGGDEYISHEGRWGTSYQTIRGLWRLTTPVSELDPSGSMLMFRLKPVSLFERFTNEAQNGVVGQNSQLKSK